METVNRHGKGRADVALGSSIYHPASGNGAGEVEGRTFADTPLLRALFPDPDSRAEISSVVMAAGIRMALAVPSPYSHLLHPRPRPGEHSLGKPPEGAVRQTPVFPPDPLQIYLEAVDELRYYAGKVRQFNVAKASTRERLAGLRPADVRAELEDQVRELDRQVTTLRRYPDQATLLLQDAVARQTRLIQMMSNVLKMMHDTAMAVTRNMK